MKWYILLGQDKTLMNAFKWTNCWSIYFGYNACLIHFFYMELNFFYMVFFLMEINLVFFVCNDFMDAKHGFHHFKCVKKNYCIFRIRFEHFMHDIFSVMHNNLIIFLSNIHTFNKN
jgi:hypothetical protein